MYLNIELTINCSFQLCADVDVEDTSMHLEHAIKELSLVYIYASPSNFSYGLSNIYLYRVQCIKRHLRQVRKQQKSKVLRSMDQWAIKLMKRDLLIDVHGVDDSPTSTSSASLYHSKIPKIGALAISTSHNKFFFI